MKYKPDICHVRDCVARSSNAESQIFPVAGDMCYLPVLLSSVARKFRNKKSNFMCKAHFLPEDMLLTRSGIMLSKRAVPCLQVPRSTLKMVIRSAISPKHSEVAGALLERARVVQSERDSSSDSDTPSEPMTVSGASQSPSTTPAFGYSYVEPNLGTVPGSEVGAMQTYVPEPTALTLQQRLHQVGKSSVKRFAENYISRHDSSFMDYKRLRISDSESPESQAEGDAASETSNDNPRPVEDVDEEDEVADVTDVGVAVSRDDGNDAMDEHDDNTDNPQRSHILMRSRVKVVTPRIRSVGTAAKSRPHNHQHAIRRRRDEADDGDDQYECQRPGETIDDVDDDDDESLIEKHSIATKRPRDQGGDDKGDEDEVAGANLKKLRRDENVLSSVHNADEDEENFADDDEVHHQQRPRRQQQHCQQQEDDPVDEEDDDGDDEEDDGDDEDECADESDGKELEGDATPSPRKVQKSSCPASQDSA